MSISNISGCIGCETCIKSCPTDVIRLDPKYKESNNKVSGRLPDLSFVPYELPG